MTPGACDCAHHYNAITSRCVQVLFWANAGEDNGRYWWRARARPPPPPANPPSARRRTDELDSVTRYHAALWPRMTRSLTPPPQHATYMDSRIRPITSVLPLLRAVQLAAYCHRGERALFALPFTMRIHRTAAAHLPRAASGSAVTCRLFLCLLLPRSRLPGFCLRLIPFLTYANAAT